MRNILILAILLVAQYSFSQVTVNGRPYQTVDAVTHLWGQERGVDLPFTISEYYEDVNTSWIMVDRNITDLSDFHSNFRRAIASPTTEFPVLYIWVNGSFDPIIYSTWNPAQINISGWKDVVMRWYWPNGGTIPYPIGDPVVVIKRN